MPRETGSDQQWQMKQELTVCTFAHEKGSSLMLTPPQLATLKTDILADATLNAFPNTADGAFEITTAYNIVASPDFWVWRTSVTKDELVAGVSVDGTTFNWHGHGLHYALAR